MCARSAPANACEDIFSYGNIYRNYLKCRQNKRNSKDALRFEINAERYILTLERQLQTKEYHPSRCLLFTAQKPKTREIFASPFKDRVVHHILIQELTKLWEDKFIYDSYSCREGKGTHKAVTRIQSFLKKITKNGNIRAYYLQLDIKDFFISIDKNILWSLINTPEISPEALWLSEKTIFWDCTKDYTHCGDQGLHQIIPPNKTLFGKENKRGLPIGNLTSQYFANIYLDKLDQYIKHTLRAKYYLRYVDDFVLLSTSQEELKEWKYKIELFLREKLRLTLHPKRQLLLPCSTGIDFLGYIVRQNYILVRKRVINNLRAKLKQNLTTDQLTQTFASYKGHFQWANSHRLTDSFSNKVNSILENYG